MELLHSWLAKSEEVERQIYPVRSQTEPYNRVIRLLLTAGQGVESVEPERVRYPIIFWVCPDMVL